MRGGGAAFALILAASQALAEGPTPDAGPPPTASNPAPSPTAMAPRAEEGALSLEKVQASVLAHHPLIDASVQRVRRAEGAELGARGYFDPTLKAQGKVTTLGYYELRTFDAEVRQRTGLWGLEVFGGYRIGRRTDDRGPLYPTYSPDQTLDGGEFRVGAELPLFRDGPIDSGRARLWTAEAAREAAALGFDRTRLEMQIAASKAYFRWIAAGQKWQVALRTLKLAEERAEQVSARTGLGLSSEFDRLDNERMVYERKERSIAARRDFEAASFDLSLFLRNGDGEPRVPTGAELPPFSPEGPSSLRGLDTKAIAERLGGCHPQLRQLRAELRATEVELRLAQNQLAPDLKAMAQVSRDIGDGAQNPALASLAGTVLEAGLKLSMPLLLSPERGNLMARSAAVEEKRAELRFAEERLEALVKDIVSRIQATHERRVQTERLADASRGLVSGERERLENGNSNLLFLNLRELAALDADSRLVDAQAIEREALYEIELLEKITCE